MKCQKLVVWEKVRKHISFKMLSAEILPRVLNVKKSILLKKKKKGKQIVIFSYFMCKKINTLQEFISDRKLIR